MGWIACHACGGSGRGYGDMCSYCAGSGRIHDGRVDGPRPGSNRGSDSGGFGVIVLFFVALVGFMSTGMTLELAFSWVVGGGIALLFVAAVAKRILDGPVGEFLGKVFGLLLKIAMVIVGLGLAVTTLMEALAN